MREIMTNLGNEKSPNRVHRNIVPIVPGEGILGPNQLNINPLGSGTIKILLFRGPIFPAFYRSICSRSITFVIQTKTNYNMKTITYTNNQGLELKINKFASGAFSLTFNNGAHSFCDTMTELRTILLKNGMTRKWAANVKDRFDPLTEEHVLIDRYRTPEGSEMEVFITSRILFVNMIGTESEMRYMDAETLARKIVRYGFKQF